MTSTIDIAAKQMGHEQESSATAVAVQNVDKSFGAQTVLNGVSLSVTRGETLAVLGRSGTGKSVLLRMIVGLEKPDSGQIRIHDEDIAGLALDQLGAIRKKMGFLFQHAALYDSLTIAENVGFPLEHHRREMSKAERTDRVKVLLAEVGLEDGFEKMPSDISGGMQKRVGLARALALEPEILLLDEPTAGLDPISSGEINDLILKLQRERKMASIVVTHDLHSARTIADRLAILNKGLVVIEGSFEDLQKSEIGFVKEFLRQS
ncbi:MAG: ABC transporter ATP-binding protein [Terracidiphilus sp.]